MTELSEKLYALLCAEAAGIARAMKIDHVARRLDTTRRDIEQATEEIRDQGLPLCSSTSRPYGLYIAQNPAEFRPYRIQLEHRIAKMSRRKKRIEQHLLRMAPQECVPMELELFA